MLSILEVVSNSMLDKGSLPCLDGHPTTNACHIQALELIQILRQKRGGKPLSINQKEWLESCLLTCTIIQDSSLGREGLVTKRTAQWAQLGQHVLSSIPGSKLEKEKLRQKIQTQSKQFVSRDVQASHQDDLAQRVLTIVKERLSKTGEFQDELSNLCETLSHTGRRRETFPKMAGVVWMVGNLKEDPDSPPLVLKMKHVTRVGHHVINYLAENVHGRWRRVQGEHQDDLRPAIVIEGVSLSQMSCREYDEEIANHCPHQLLCRDLSATHSLKEECPACRVSSEPLEGEPNLEGEGVESFMLEVAASFQKSKQSELLGLLGPKIAAMQVACLEQAERNGHTFERPTQGVISHIHADLVANALATQRLLIDRSPKDALTLILSQQRRGL